MKFFAPIALALAGSTVNALSLKKAETAVAAHEINNGPMKDFQKPLKQLNKISKNLVQKSGHKKHTKAQTLATKIQAKGRLG